MILIIGGVGARFTTAPLRAVLALLVIARSPDLA